MAVEVGVGVPADGGHHRRSDRQVGHEMPVHDVDVQPVGLGPDPVDLDAEGGEIGRQDRGGDADHRGVTLLPGTLPAGQDRVHAVGAGRLRKQQGPPAGRAATAAPGGGRGTRSGAVRASQPSMPRVSSPVSVHTL